MTIIILLAFAVVVLLNILLLKMYCGIQFKRSKRIIDNETHTKIKDEQPQGVNNIYKVKKKNIRTKIISKLFFIMDSILRLNMHIVGYIPSHFLRMLFYTQVCYMKVAEKVVIYHGAEIRAPWNITIGKGSIIGDHAILDGRYGIEIGENVNLSTGVWIWTLQHDVQSSDFSIAGQGKKVVIGDRVWLSCRSVILPGVHIGTGSVVAASALVAKNLGEFSIFAGVPAVKIGDRNRNINYEFSGNHYWFL